MGTRVPWVFTNQRTSTAFQSSVLSASFNIGRQTYMDAYNGGSLVFTIKNQANQAAGFQMNDVIEITAPTGFYLDFWVDEIQFSDYPGNTGLSTATIVCSDAVTRFGRNLVVNRNLTQTSCILQAEQLNPVSFSEFPRVIPYASSSQFSTASPTVYTGAPMTRINQLINTERGLIKQIGLYLTWFNRAVIASAPAATVSFGRNSVSASVIGYQQFSRIGLGMNFMNNVTVTPQGGAEQISENSASVALYGSSYYSVESVDATNAQAKGLSEWLSNSQSDPTALRFELSFDDRSQANVNSVQKFLTDERTSLSFLIDYQVPGSGSITQTRAVVEGYSVDITPSDSTFRVYFSPLAYYQFFTLDSAVLGVLNTSRLGW